MNGWDDYAQEWDTDPATRRYAELAFASLTLVLEHHDVTLANARVLDFGGGTGLLTEHLLDAGASVDVFDASAGLRVPNELVVLPTLPGSRWRAGEAGLRVFLATSGLSAAGPGHHLVVAP